MKILRLEDYPKKKHPLIRAILQCGGNPAAFGRTLGVSHQLVRRWLISSQYAVSPRLCSHIEELTGGDITRQQLRPDIYGEPKINELSPQDLLKKCIGILCEIASDLPNNTKKRGK